MPDNFKNANELESQFLFWNDYYDRIGSIFPHRDVPSFQVHPRYHVPSHKDRKTIKNQLSSCDTAIDALESEVLQLQEVTSLLQLRLENYRSYKRFKCSLLTSINNLPDETLSNIFFYTFGGVVDVLDVEPFHPLTKKRIDGRIWDLQLVCVRWRDIILGNPLLWSHFELLTHSSLRKDHKPSLTVVSGRIQSCLKYSRASTLTISITCEVSSVVPISAIEDIAHHADRLESFTITHEFLLQALENTEMEALIKKRGLLQLRKLNIVGFILDYSDIRSNCPLEVFAAAIALEDVSLKDACLYYIDELPWRTVRKLELRECELRSEDELHTLLESMPSLEELIWSNNQFVVVGPEFQPIVLPSLRTLVVEKCVTMRREPEDMDKIPISALRTLYMPHLTNLVTGTPEIGTLFEVLRNSACVIKSLEVRWGCTDYIVPIITELSAVEELSMWSMADYHYDKLLRKLIWDPTRGPGATQLLPSLRKLVIHAQAVVQDDTISLMGAILRSRSSETIEAMQGQPVALAPLVYVEFYADFDWGEEDPAIYHLEDLGRDLGIEFKLHVNVH